MQRAGIEGKARDVSVDIIKGLGIACMIAGHCGAPFTNFVYLFHMAIFFIASGYCYKEKNAESWRGLGHFLWRRIVTLWFPYVLWTTIYTALHNVFIRLNVYTDNPLLLEYASGPYIGLMDHISRRTMLNTALAALRMEANTQLGGAFWFLVTLFELSVSYVLIDYLLRKLLRCKDTAFLQTFLSIVFLATGYRCYLTGNQLTGFDKVFSYYILFHGGYLLRRFRVNSRERSEIWHAILFAVAFAVLLWNNPRMHLELGSNSYVTPAYLLLNSAAGWVFLYELAHYIQKIAWLKKLMVVVGQNTMGVVILHFLSFKLVNLAGVLVERKPLCLVAAFPVLYQGGVWWIAYFVVGLGLPVCASLAWKWVKGKAMAGRRLKGPGKSIPSLGG